MIRGQPPVLSEGDLCYLAARALAAAADATMEAVAEAAGARVVAVPRLPVRAALLPDGTILARPCRSARVWTLALAHEIAHWLLRGQHHSHGDVWVLAILLTGELAGPALAAE